MRVKVSAKRRLAWMCACLTLAATLVLPAAAKKKPSAQPAQQQADADQANKGNGPGAESVRDKDDPRARAKYLETRRSGGQPVPRGARLRAMQEQQQMMINEGKAFWDEAAKSAVTERSGASPQRQLATPESNSAPLPLSSTQWVFIGPQPTNPNPANGGGGNHFSGRVTAMAVDPSDTSGNTVYLGGAQGGVWKTTDGGTNWAPLTDNQPSLAVGSIVLDPVSPQTVYVGTGEENFGSDSYYGVGILKSTNGSGSWSNIGATAFGVTEPECTGSTDGIASVCGGLRIGGLAAVNQSGTTALLAAVQGALPNSAGVYLSTNGGLNWTRKLTGIGDSVVWGSSSVAYASMDGSGTGSPVGVYVSMNSGSTFNLVAGNSTLLTVPQGQSAGRIVLAVDPTNAATVYASVEGSGAGTSQLAGLYKSTDSGATWLKLNVPDYCGGGQVINGILENSDQCFYDNVVAVNPANPSVIFAGGSGFPNPSFLVKSTDGGTTWNVVETNIHADQHAMAFVPNGASVGKLYVGNDGGAYSTTDTGTGTSVNWTELNTTLGITQFYSYFSIDPDNSQLTYAGTQDNGTQRFSGDMFWDEMTCGDGSSTVIDRNSGRIFANCTDVDVRESDDGSPGSFNGSDGSEVSGISPSDTVAFIPPMIGDNSSPQNLYFGTNTIYRAPSSVSLLWTNIHPSGPLTNGGTDSFTNIISNMDISPDNTTMYVVTGDGRVWKATGLPNSPVFTNVTNGLSPAGNFITSVRISPSDNNTAYISLAGFNSPKQHIFKSTGGAWVDISGNLPNTPVNDLVLDPDLPGVIYAATDTGVYSATDNGTSTVWSTLTTTLPRVAVLGLRLHRDSRTLRAATHGRGMWDLYVPICTANAPCALLSSTTLNFGALGVGTSSAPQSVTVTNTGGSALIIGAVDLGGADFIQTNNCGTLPPNASCTITVTFTPGQPLARKGSVKIFSNGGRPATIALTGTGLVTPVNDDVNSAITISSLPFTATVITNGATTSATDPTPPLTNASEIVSPNPGANDSFDNCVGVYNPSNPLGYVVSATFNHHSIWFNYTPQASGNIDLDTLQTSGIDTVITVWTGAPGSFNAVTNGCNDDQNAGVVKQSQILNLPVTQGTTYKIMVSGYYASDSGAITFHMAQSSGSGATGTPITVTPAPVNFIALLRRPSASQTFTITNTSAAVRTISSLAVGSSDYSLSHNCPLTTSGFGIGAICTATVTLTPTVVGVRNSTLTISDDASGTPQIVALTGFAFDFNLANPRASRPARGTGVIQGQQQKFEVALNTSTGGATVPVTVSCADAPPGSTCTVTPSQVNAGDGSTPITVTLQTSAGSANAVSARSRRLGASTGAGSIGGTSTGTPAGSYNLKVTARVGDAETTTLVPVNVIAPPRAARISH